MAEPVDLEDLRHGTTLVKRGFARMQKGGVVMDVTSPEEAQIAEEAGAVAVMALERVPADIRDEGGVARMTDPAVIEEIIDTVTIPVMAKARIGHKTEARVLESLGVDMIDESEVLTPADPYDHIPKEDYTVPFVCGCRDLGQAVRRVWEGAAMIRTKGEAGTGNIQEAVRHRRQTRRAIQEVQEMDKSALESLAEHYASAYSELVDDIRRDQAQESPLGRNDVVLGGSTYEEVTDGILGVLLEVKKRGRLPVVDFAAGGIATPADAALMMRLGNDGVFVGSGIFKSGDPETRAEAIVEATTHWDDPEVVAEVSRNLGEAMSGLDEVPEDEQLQTRGD
jgi:pyridoxal 5'-phosphate synthase pdxS subunit